ncbi:MAG: hypothetical protein GY820_47205 [Gammaproteobacteria bacterium]|nr:hypothetical protein [Gammaproteobacteria bacterium]
MNAFINEFARSAKFFCFFLAQLAIFPPSVILAKNQQGVPFGFFSTSGNFGGGANAPPAPPRARPPLRLGGLITGF